MEDYTQGTQVGAPLIPGSPQDTYPTHYAALGHGGWRSVASVAERDLIPAGRRGLGMQVRCIAEDMTFELKDGLLNVNWKPVKKGITSLESAPIQIGNIWTGTQDQFRTLKLQGLLVEGVIYNYEPIMQVVREPAEVVSFILNEFDNNTDQVIKSTCNFTLPSAVEDFKLRFIVTKNLVVNIYGGTMLKKLSGASGTVGDSVLGIGAYNLIKDKNDPMFYLW